MNDLRNAADKARDWTERRDNIIRAYRIRGHSLRDIAAAAGLSHQQVDNIAKRER